MAVHTATKVCKTTVKLKTEADMTESGSKKEKK
jgi:hypothetical protein